MLTPSKYWRIAQTLDAMQDAPPTVFTLPANIAAQNSPPTVGHGLLLADYSERDETGIVRFLGIVTGRTRAQVNVEWKPVEAEIWVDTGAGRGFWKKSGGFGFAANKVTTYGLPQLFADAFGNLEARESLPDGHRAESGRQGRRGGGISPERLNPMTVVGEPTAAPLGGYVYVLKSAHGYKVGRTRSIPNRMRAFGVKLPFLYTIPVCAWFDDHIQAEAAYHRLFRDKHINGEWFSLRDDDVDLVRARTFIAVSADSTVDQAP